MRQRTDPQKIKILADYHKKILNDFRKGRLTGKVCVLLKIKAQEIQIGLRTYWRAKKGNSGRF